MCNICVIMVLQYKYKLFKSNRFKDGRCTYKILVPATTKLLSRLSHKVCCLLRKFTNISPGS